MLKTASEIFKEQEIKRNQLQNVNLFLDKYYLQESEINCLESSDINESFFLSFEKLAVSQRHIEEEMEKQPSQLLIEVSSSLSAWKERGFQKIYQWLHHHSYFF